MPSESVGQGTLRTIDGVALPLERTDVRARIGGPVATVEVRQLFRNTSAEPIEAVYCFPLPHEASVHRMELRIADRVVRAVVKEKEEARRTYERAKSEGRAATLLEQDRPSLFTLSVANVPPAASVEVRLEYQEMIGFDDGEWRFVFPLVAPERYVEMPESPAGGGGHAPSGPSQSAQSTTPAAAGPTALPTRAPRLPSGERADEVTLEVEVRTDGPVESLRCASHRCDIEPIEDGARRVKLHPGGVANRDFVLTYRASESGVRPHTWFSREPGQEGTLLLVLAPPSTDAPKTSAVGGGSLKALACGNCGGIVTDLSSVKEIPGLGPVVRCVFCGALLTPSTDPPFTRATRARDVTVLLDRSASMRGSVTQARRAVRALLDALAPGDGIQVIAFDHERIAFDGDGTRFVALAPEVVSRIDAFLTDLSARGGSELEAALQHVAKLPVREGRTRAVVLVTDAAIGNEGRLLRRAPEILGVERRLFVLGLGPAVDRRLVAKLARTCGGASDTLLPNEDVEPVLARFARRVRDGGPVLTGVSITWSGPAVTEIYPPIVPDLYGGEPIRLLGRFAEHGTSKLVITAMTADSRPFRQEVDIALPESSDRVPGLVRIWAKTKVDALLERSSRDAASSERVKREVTDLALAHALVTPYTSLVAEDSEVVAKQKPRRTDVPSPSPEGGRGEGVGHAADHGATRGRAAEHVGSRGMLDLEEESLDDLSVERDGGDRPTGAPAPMAAPMGVAGFARAAGPPPSPGAYGSPSMGGGPPPTGAPPMRPAAAPRSAGPAAPPPAMPAPPMRVSSPSAMGPPPPLAQAKGKSGGVLSVLKRAFGVDDARPSDDGEARVESARFDEPTPLAPEGYGGSYDPESAKAATIAASAASAARRAQGQSPSQSAWSEPAGSEPYDARELEWLANKRTGELDLVFLVDETGSMGPYIAQVQARLLDLVATLRASPLCRSMRLGLVSYRDHAPQDHTYASKVVPLTEDIDAIERAVRALVASGGGDGPESVTDGLVDIVRLDWRPNAARAVAWFGDAPPHGVSLAGDAWPNGCPCGHHWYTQAESCREMGIAVYAVGCLPNLRHYAGGEDVYRTVATTSRGIYLPLSESALLVPLIAGAAVTELDKQRLDEHVADVVAANASSLGRTDESERVRWITDVLRAQRVRPREMVYEPNRAGPAPMLFRDARAADVEGSLDRLRRSGRLSL